MQQTACKCPSVRFVVKTPGVRLVGWLCRILGKTPPILLTFWASAMKSTQSKSAKMPQSQVVCGCGKYRRYPGLIDRYDMIFLYRYDDNYNNFLSCNNIASAIYSPLYRVIRPPPTSYTHTPPKLVAFLPHRLNTQFVDLMKNAKRIRGVFHKRKVDR